MPYPNLLARGVTGVGAFEPFELFAGESDIVTGQGYANQPIRQFAMVKRAGPDNSSLLEVSGPTDKVVGIAAQAAAAGENFPYYTGGVFNIKAVILPDPDANYLLILDGTNMSFGTLL